MDFFNTGFDGIFEMTDDWQIECLICGNRHTINCKTLNLSVDDAFSHVSDSQLTKEHYFWQEYFCEVCQEKHIVRVKVYESMAGKMTNIIYGDNDNDDFIIPPKIKVYSNTESSKLLTNKIKNEGEKIMKQKDLRTYQRRGATRESGYHTCDETTGGECIISFAEKYITTNTSTVFSFYRSSLELVELFEKSITIIAFGGYVHSSNKATVSFELSYIYEGQKYNFSENSECIIEQNSWKNIGFHICKWYNKVQSF